MVWSTGGIGGGGIGGSIGSIGDGGNIGDGGRSTGAWAGPSSTIYTTILLLKKCSGRIPTGIPKPRKGTSPQAPRAFGNFFLSLFSLRDFFHSLPHVSRQRQRHASKESWRTMRCALDFFRGSLAKEERPSMRMRRRFDSAWRHFSATQHHVFKTKFSLYVCLPVYLEPSTVINNNF